MSRRFAEALGTAFVLLLAASPAPAQAPLQVPRERVLSLDMRIDPQSIAVAGNAGPPGPVWPRTTITSRFPQGGGLDGLRVHVVLDAPLGAGRTLRILDATGTEIDVVSGDTEPALRDFWSREVPGGTAIVDLIRSTPGQAPGAAVSYAYHVIPTEQQAISGPDQIMSLSDAPPRLRALGKPVARLRFIIDQQGQASCTAFVVGPRLVLTNEHCISNEQERASALLDFNYDQEDSPTPGIRVSAIVARDPGLDYSLLRLAAEPPEGVGRLYFVPAGWTWHTPPTPHALLIIQHPSGLPKKVSIADCTLAGLDRIGVTKGDKSDFGHLCDTLGGSSGSPVLDWDSGLVVGLHHFGFLDGSSEPVNQAVVHLRLLADILRQDKAVFAEVTRARPQ